MKKIFLLLIAVFSFAAITIAQQVSNYGFSASAGTYTPITGGTTAHNTGWDDANATAIPIGFSFNFNGTSYTTCTINTNGYITFGTTTPPGGSPYTPISDATGYAGAIAALGRDLQAQATAPLGLVQYSSTGGVFTVQWSDSRRYFSTTANAERFEFQIKLFQTTNVIQIIYGNFSNAVSATTANLAQVGLRGASNTDFKSLEVLSSGNWASPTAGATNASTCYYNEGTTATKPSLGQTYTFTPPPPCVTPADQPTALNLTPGAGSVAGSFTAAASLPSNYLVIRTTTPAAPTAPVDGTTYAVGNTTLGGTVVSAGTTTNFLATGLSSSTTYYFWIYSFNHSGCSGGPLYRTTSPLTQSSATTACTVTGTKTVGPTGNYATLTAAIADINLNGLGGPVLLELQPTYTSTSETFPLVINPVPCASAANTLTIRPQAGATGLSIAGSNATGIINFDGGDYVIIDGRAGGTGPSQLTISNTSTSGYTVQLINSATNNTIKYCTIDGVNTSTTSGVILFNTAVGFTDGNSFNTIDNCDIKAGTTTPTNLIYAAGTATSFATQNNSNTISNCTLHDWFNASSTTIGAAINITNAASDWTITGNSFYQTASRVFTMTTSTEQGAIFITSTANNSANFTITNNFIGGTAPNCGGTALTWSGTGTTGTPVIRMLRLSTATAAVNNITGNTIANIAFVTASASTGHGLLNVLNGNTNISNNTIGSQSATGNITYQQTGTSTAPFFVPLGFGLGANVSNYNVTNNNIGGISVSAATTAAVSFRVVYTQAVAGSAITISGNTIGGTIANSIQQATGTSTAGTGSLFGMLVLNPTIGNVITNNTVRNLTITSTVAGPSLTGINDQASGGAHIITGNTVYNLTTSSANIATNNAASVVGITLTANVVGGSNCSNNTVYNLTNTNTTVAGWINGMYFGTAPAPQPQNIISRNFIHSIKVSSATSGAGMNGISIPNTGPAAIYNNMIRLGIDASGASLTNALQINGINKIASGAVSVYFNTVYIGGTGVVSGTANTSAFRRSTSVAGDTVMNNIFYNARSNASGTGKHYAINLNNTTTITSNYNNLVANGTGGVLGIINTTDYATIPAWQTGSAGLDINSISGDPAFINATGDAAAVNLHIAATPTVIEQAGLALPFVPNDFDDQVRSGLTPTDIGADAGNFVVNDIAPPSILLSPLNAGCSTGDRTFTVDITDATGVATGGTAPRVYYRKGAGSYFSQAGTLQSGTVTNGTWSFTIVAADMGGLVTGDVVSYYVIAQDAAGNIVSNPGGAVATNVNTVTTPPTTPYNYTITNNIPAGTYTVGSGGAYPTLTAAIAAYNTSCLGGPIVFSLTDASYSASETFPLVINNNTFASAVNTLTIKPASGVSPVISGANATSIFSLAGARYIIIDGSNTAGGTTKDMTIANTNTSGATVRFIGGASSNTVKNNIITGVTTSTTNGVVFFSTAGTTGNNNNTVQNNTITKGTTLPANTVYNSGSAGLLVNTGNLVTGNDVSDFSAVGILDAGNSNGAVYSYNNVFGTVTQTTTTSLHGIQMNGTTIQAPSIIGNKVYDLKTGNTSATTGYLQGIDIFEIASGTTCLVANNFVSLTGNGTNAPGIRIAGIADESTAGTANIYNNTVSINGVSTSTNGSFAYLKNFSNTSVLRNNILSNTRLSSGASGNQYAIYHVSGAGPFSSNYNNLYSNGNALNVLGGYSSTDRLTLAAWQTGSGGDANAISVAPVFISATDLHLDPAVSCNIDGKGTPLASVPLDIDGNTRNATTPDIGADEFTSTFILTITNPAAVCSPATIDLTAAAVTAGSTAGSVFTYFTDPAATAPLANPNAVAVPGTYYIKSVNGSCTDIKPVVVAIGTPPSAAINYAGTPYCQSAGTATVTQTGTAGGTYSATPAGLSINPTTGAITLGTSTPGTYTVSYDFPASGGCPATSFTTPVTVTATPNATISYPSSPYCNVGTAAPTQTGTTGGTYTSAPAGITINPSTGQINLLASTPGAYTITYTIAAAGGCPVFTTTAPITINSCTPPVVTVTATAGNTGPVGYTSLKLAFDEINNGTHQGAITVNINGNTNEGATPAVLNGSGGTSNYTSVLVRPTADNLSVSAGTMATSRGVIELNGADNVTIDGDNPNSVGTNRNLSITAIGTTATTALIWIKSVSAADGATNNTIKNCILVGQNQINTTIGILAGSSTFGGAAAAANSNTTIDNNAFSRSQNGIYWNGFATGPAFDANLAITNNNFGSTIAADKHIFRGMILQNVSNFTISGNTIQGVSSTTTSSSNMSGIQLAGSGNGGNIFNNKISDIKQNNPTGWGAEGITLGFTNAPANVNVYNNFISDVAGRGFAGTSTPASGFSVSDNGNGIAIVAGGGYNIYYNTVHMNTDQANNGNPAALLINTVTPANTLNIRNNIFTNTQTVGTNRYSVVSVPGAGVYADINYNDYYTAGPNLGNFAGTNIATFAAWQTATTKDANSRNVLPVFVSATDLHLAASGNCALDGTGTPIATYTTDIDGNTRNVTTPDIGADEFASAPRTATISYNSAPYCVSGGTATVTQTGTTGGVYTAPAGVTINASTGAITLGTSTAGTYTITYTVPALGACPVVVTTTSITINAAPSATISYAGSPYCQNAGTATVTQTGSTGGTYSAAPAGLTINATTGAVTLGTSTPGTYTVTYTIAPANGCAVYTTTASITVTATPNATISYPGSPYCQNAGTATVTQTGTTGGTYSSTAGLTINATTGAVTLGTSTPGTYTVTYTVAAAGGCAAFSTTASITITATPSATISYTGSPYCQNAGTANVTRTGTAGGTYSAPAGLSINASTGAVTLGTSTPGTYTVTYTVAAAGGCAVYTTTTSITITPTPSATISYAGSPYCPTGTATVTRTGTAGGTYSSTAGLSINAANGDVNLGASTPGTYTVTYTVAAAGGCAAYSTTTTIVINTLSVAPTGATTSIGTSCGPATVTLSVQGGSLGAGASWKWYSGSCGGTAVGTGASININVTGTTTYYVRAEGTCNTTACASVTVTINPQPVITIAASPYTSLLPGLVTTLTATVVPSMLGDVLVWYRNGSVIPGATGNSINVTVDELGAYTARVTSIFGCTDLSNEVVIKDSATDRLFISPNPNNGRFKVRYYSNAQNFGFLRTLLIYDSKGAKVFDQRMPVTAPYSSMDVDMRKNGKGIYVVVVADHLGKPMAQGKVVIQ